MGWATGVRFLAEAEFSFSWPPGPDRLWDPPSLIYNGYQGLFAWGWSGRNVKLTTHLHPLPRSRMRGAYQLSLLRDNQARMNLSRKCVDTLEIYASPHNIHGGEVAAPSRRTVPSLRCTTFSRLLTLSHYWVFTVFFIIFMWMRDKNITGLRPLPPSFLRLNIHYYPTERPCPVSSSTVCSEGPGFDSLPEGRLFWLRFLVILFRSSTS